MTRQAMNYLLGELERLGYLLRRDDPENRRSKRVHLTERGTGGRADDPQDRPADRGRRGVGSGVRTRRGSLSSASS